MDEDRTAVSGYADLELRLSDSFLISPAVRVENYSDFGATANGKIAARLEIMEELALRSSISTGFRAPSMQQLYFNNVSTQFNIDPVTGENIPQEIGTFRNDSDIASAVGIPDLEEETSINGSVGFVFQPFHSLYLTTDFYHITVDDRIIVSGALTPTGAGVPDSVGAALIGQGVSSAQFFMNAADTRTRGFDIVASWDVPFVPWGALNLNLLGSLSETKITSVNLPAGLPSSLFTAVDRGILEDWQPKTHFALSGVYRLDRFTAAIALHRYGQYRVHEGGGRFVQNFSARYLTDIQLSYDLGRFGILKAGVNNLFDVRPERNNVGQSRGGTIIDPEGNQIVDSRGVFKYSRRAAPFGFNGAFYYTAFEYQF